MKRMVLEYSYTCINLLEMPRETGERERLARKERVWYSTTRR